MLTELCCVLRRTARTLQPEQAPAMPSKGKAFDKPTHNALHKAESVKVARMITEKAASERDGVALECCTLIEKSALDSERQRQACRAIDEACAKLGRGDNPLCGLRPPDSCAPCGGRSGGTHHFLCQARKLQPTAPEKGVRMACVARLQAAWRARQHALQEVCHAPCRDEAHPPLP